MEKKELKILIAEDDFLVSEEIVRIIKQIGYIHAGTAPNGLKAVEMVKEIKPDLVLMDIKMPKLNGLEAAKIIQDIVPTPIVILTAHESQSLVENASENGVGAYLTKPPIAEEIERAVTIAFARQTDLINSRKLISLLEKKERELKELNSSKDKFFSIIAHDLRNPISALIGYSNLMIDSYYDMNDEEKIDISRSLKQLSENVSLLLESLLQWSRFETGRMEYNPENFSLIDEINDVIKLLKPSADKKNISIHTNFNKARGVYADKNMIKTILRNLISNAIKFTKEKGKVSIETEKVENEILIKVIDNGVGMSKEHQNDLFDLNKSKSTKGTNYEKGSGLGLLLCRELISKNNGALNIESEVNKGTKISFALQISKL